jgi:hypothetical protein
VFRKRSRSLCEGIVHVHAEIACIITRPRNHVDNCFRVTLSLNKGT